MHHILLVEDSLDFQVMVRKILSAPNYKLTIAGSVSEARQAIKGERFDLILLDIGLPDMDGLQFFGQMVTENPGAKAHVIFLTGSNDLANKVAAFSLGAEDYIVKPFDPTEFRARIDAKLRRGDQTQAEEDVFTKHGFKLQISLHKVWDLSKTPEQDLNLTPLEFRIFHLLMRNEGRVLSREQILNSVWGNQVHVFDRTVDTHIYTLRKKLGDRSKTIESVPGSGYRFSTPARSSQAA